MFITLPAILILQFSLKAFAHFILPLLGAIRACNKIDCPLKRKIFSCNKIELSNKNLNLNDCKKKGKPRVSLMHWQKVSRPWTCIEFVEKSSVHRCLIYSTALSSSFFTCSCTYYMKGTEHAKKKIANPPRISCSPDDTISS